MSISDVYRRLRGDVLYHYTHQGNVESIKNSGYVLYSSKCINSRNICPYYITDNTSRYIDMQRNLDNYVFLVFTLSHPMIYKKECEGVPMTRIPIDVSILDLPGVLISNTIATCNNAEFFTPQEALIYLDIENSHDGNYLYSDEWYRVKDYEILVPMYIDLRKYFYRM